jgi:isocitrate dehydrogenase kinase/phosphatase
MTTSMTLATPSILPRRPARGRAFASAVRASHCAQLVAEGFMHYDAAFRELTGRSPVRFAQLDWQGSQIDEAERIELYAHHVERTAGVIRERVGEQLEQSPFWEDVMRHFALLTEAHPLEEICRSFCRSVLVDLYRSGDSAFMPAFPEAGGNHPLSLELAGVRRVSKQASIDGLLAGMLQAIPIETDWADLASSTAQVSRAILLDRELLQTIGELQGIEMLDTVFYRFTRAYVVGCLRGIGGRIAFALELKNGEDGMSIQHVLLGAGSVNTLFRFAGSCFHVELEHPVETAAYLQMLLPDLSTGEFLTVVGRPNREGIALAG